MTRHRPPYRRYGPDPDPVVALGYEIETGTVSLQYVRSFVKNVRSFVKTSAVFHTDEERSIRSDRGAGFFSTKKRNERIKEGIRREMEMLVAKEGKEAEDSLRKEGIEAALKALVEMRRDPTVRAALLPGTRDELLVCGQQVTRYVEEGHDRWPCWVIKFHGQTPSDDVFGSLTGDPEQPNTSYRPGQEDGVA